MKKLLFVVLAIMFIACEKENVEPEQEQQEVIKPTAKFNVDKLIGNWYPVKYTSRFPLNTQPELLKIDNTGTEWMFSVTKNKYYQSYTVQSYNLVDKLWIDSGKCYIKFVGDTLRIDQPSTGIVIKYLKY